MALTVVLEGDKSDRVATEKSVDEDLEEFKRWFAERIGGDPLSKFELAAIKTYLYFKFYGDEKDAQAGS